MVSFSDPFFIAFAVILIIVNLCFMFLLKLVIETKILKKTDASPLTPESANPQTEAARTESKTQKKQTEKTGLLKRVRKTVKSVTRREPRNGTADFCPKFLGYLHTLPKGSGYPDECLRCRRIISCMGVQGGVAIEEFYADEAVAE